MADVEFDGMSKVYDNNFRAVDHLDLKVSDGEFLVLVGPSGCGKSTALRMVAGLEDISEGELRIGGARMNEVMPRERDIAMVFQSYALYPHLSVAENIGFGLALRKMPKHEINERVHKAADMLGLVDLLDRRPKMLSGGQRQRVAMGRAIVREPKVFLMDEPLSNLDAKLRVQMRAEISKLQRAMGVTTIYVTHDQVEAMTMADRVAVMRRGVLQQVAHPWELYDRPANLFVAGFIGSPAMNMIAATVVVNGDAVQIDIAGQLLDIPQAALDAYPQLRQSNGRQIIAGIRPEFFTFPADFVPSGQQLRIDVDMVESTGSETHVHFGLPIAPINTDDVRDADDDAGEIATTPGDNRTMFVAKLDGLARVRMGDAISIGIHTDRCHFFDRESGAPLR
ncbi:MAG TPA: sn-glycerol-3-phosphate ABC transporter ATP-binding protein UgpC [Ilumatobacteraceae bacterium]|nr:sn-glycerol-3-phosphate ABC transporter ATP-binding protein UgpC [Ilumatobacteraceae bacterium]